MVPKTSMRAPPNLPFMDRLPAFTVGLRPIEYGAWLTPDWEAGHLAEKRALMAADLDAVSCAHGASAPVQAEAAGLIGAALGVAHAPATLVDAAHLVSDDLVVVEAVGGIWTVTALSLCSPTYFSAADALGRDLSHLHGPVPAGAGFSGRIDRVFDALQPDVILERMNWTVQPTVRRYTPRSQPLRAVAATIADADALDVMHLRVERQTVRRLPSTGGVLFTIRVSLDPLRAVFAVDGARDAFERAWAGAPTALRNYKGWAAYDRPVQAALRA